MKSELSDLHHLSLTEFTHLYKSCGLKWHFSEQEGLSIFKKVPWKFSVNGNICKDADGKVHPFFKHSYEGMSLGYVS